MGHLACLWSWLHSWLAGMHPNLGLGITPSMHRPAPSFCRQATYKEEKGHWDVVRGLGSHAPGVEGKAPSGPQKTLFYGTRRAEQPPAMVSREDPPWQSGDPCPVCPIAPSSLR